MKKKTILFLTILVITSLAMAALGFGIREYLLTPLGIEQKDHPIALPFVLMKDKMLQARIEIALEEKNNPPTEPPVTETTAAPTEPETEPPTEPETTVPETTIPELDESWFDDALFIGESRIQGLSIYSRLGEADYFCAASMTVLGILDARMSDETFTTATLDSLLTSREYGKIYIHLGINETPLGPDGILRGYQRIIDRIRQLEPDAVIVLMGCMPITKDYCRWSGIDINVVHGLNEKLKALAESDPEVFRFCDTSAWAAGEDGYLIPEITHDGCHLFGDRYDDWSAFLLEEARYYNIP